MCGAKPPAPTPIRSAARAPDAGDIAVRSDDALRRRQTMAGMILTDQPKMGAAPVAAKPVLGV